ARDDRFRRPRVPPCSEPVRTPALAASLPPAPPGSRAPYPADLGQICPILCETGPRVQQPSTRHSRCSTGRRRPLPHYLRHRRCHGTDRAGRFLPAAVAVGGEGPAHRGGLLVLEAPLGLSFGPGLDHPRRRMVGPEQMGRTLLTGSLTAWGAGWNALIVAEYLQFGRSVYSVTGLGASLFQATVVTGDYVMGYLTVLAMTVVVLTLNKLVWRPIYKRAAVKYRMDV